MNEASTFTPLMLTVLRESRKMSQTKLADEAGVTQSAISQYEANLITPGRDVLRDLAAALRCPPSLLCVPLRFQQLPITFFRRKKSGVGVKDIRAIRARVNLYRLRMEILLRSVDLPEAKFIMADTEADGLSPSEAAQRLRVYWNVAPGPILNLTGLIERHGIIVVPMDFGTEAVDGLSLYDPGDTLPPMIFVNPNIPADRWRLNLAHELGHIVLHHHLSVPPSDDAIENEAFEFAAEFIAPRREVSGQLRHVSMNRLAVLKRHWRASMAFFLMYATRLGYISKSRARKFWIQLGKAGRSEPVDIPPEQATTLKSIVDRHIAELGYSIEDLSILLHQRPEEVLADWGLRRAHLRLA